MLNSVYWVGTVFLINFLHLIADCFDDILIKIFFICLSFNNANLTQKVFEFVFYVAFNLDLLQT